jgi:hypothetical protein
VEGGSLFVLFFPHFLKKENSFAASKQHLLLPSTDGTKRRERKKIIRRKTFEVVEVTR